MIAPPNEGFKVRQQTDVTSGHRLDSRLLICVTFALLSKKTYSTHTTSDKPHISYSTFSRFAARGV